MAVGVLTLLGGRGGGGWFVEGLGLLSLWVVGGLGM